MPQLVSSQSRRQREVRGLAGAKLPSTTENRLPPAGAVSGKKHDGTWTEEAVVYGHGHRVLRCLRAFLKVPDEGFGSAGTVAPPGPILSPEGWHTTISRGLSTGRARKMPSHLIPTANPQIPAPSARAQSR